LINVRNTSYLYFEKNYGEVLGYPDEDYQNMGANIVDREIIYKQDIICNIHAPEPVEQTLFCKGQTFFGFIDALQGRKITDFLLGMKITAIAWEEMFENGRTVFWRNNEIAGEAGVFHAFSYYGRLPYECSVAVIGTGNAGSAVIKLLEKTGIIVTPGIGYGEYGEGYVRIALTVDERRLEEAVERLEKSDIARRE
ncbi:unnamed protein product, partial [marine sediment metagenome]